MTAIDDRKWPYVAATTQVQREAEFAWLGRTCTPAEFSEEGATFNEYAREVYHLAGMRATKARIAALRLIANSGL